MGLGTFDRPQQGNANLHPNVAGFIGTLQLPRAMPVYVSLSIGPVVIASQPVNEVADSTLFVVDPMAVSRLEGSLRLVVLSAETRQPISGAAVQVGYANRPPGDEDALTDEIGRVELHHLAPGPTQLWVSAAGFEECGFDATIPAGSTLDFGTVELHPATRVSGRVVHATGEPAPSAYVTVFLDESVLKSSSLSRPFTTTKADDDGYFALENLGRRRYALVVLTHDPNDSSYTGSRKALVQVDATLGSVADLLVTVQPAPAVTLINPAGREGVSFHLRHEAVPIFDWCHDVPYLTSPDQQKFSLVPGSYVLETVVPGQAMRTRQIVLGSEPMTIDVSQ
jgi:hypothetical protein